MHLESAMETPSLTFSLDLGRNPRKAHIFSQAKKHFKS